MLQQYYYHFIILSLLICINNIQSTFSINEVIIKKSNTKFDLPSVPVFSPGDGGVTCYRIPSIVQSPRDGILLAFAEARHGSCGDSEVHEIALKRSHDSGETWSDVSFAVGNSSYFVGNPTVVALMDGTIMLIYAKHSKTCNGDCATGNGIVISKDTGETWSEPKDLNYFGDKSLPGPGTALETSTGRILFVSHKGAYQNDYVTYSDDHGETWQTNKQNFPTMDEAQLTQLGNGSIMLNMRHKKSSMLGRATAISLDGGITFGPIRYDKTLISPVCQASIVTFNNITYFSNPADTNERDKITIRKSLDDARTWASSLHVHEGKTFGYSCLVDAELAQAKGHGGILFESSNSIIAFAKFNLNF